MKTNSLRKCIETIEIDISSYEDIAITEKGASDKILGEEG